MNRKIVTMLLTGTMLAANVAGTVQAEEEKPFEGVTLRFAPNWGSGEDSEIGRTMLNEFCEKTGLTVELEEIAGDEMKNKISVDVAAGNEPDVWQYWPGAVCRDLAAAGVLANCEEYLEKSEVVKKDHFSEAALSPCTFDGELLVLPRMGASAVFMINKEIFDQYGLEAPKTWDDLMEVSKVLRDNGITPLNVGSKLGNPSHFFYNEIVDQFTSGVQDVNNLKDINTATFKTEAMEYAANLIEEMVDAGCFAEDVMGSTGDWAPATAYYNEGYSAMCYTLSWQFSSIPDEMVEKSEIIKVPQIAETDRSDNHIQGTTNDCWCISRKGWEDEKKQDAIVALMDFLMWDLTKELSQRGYMITIDNVLDKEIDYSALDCKLMTEVFQWRNENNIESDPMIWQSLPGLAIQTDYCNALDELWAGSISGSEFIEKCENSIHDNA